MRLRSYPSLRCCGPLRVIRGARPDRNPLRRGIDRLETCLLVGLFVALTAVTPFAARLAGHISYQSALHARQEQLVTRHQVRAVLDEVAGQISGYTLSAYVLTQATWTSVGGVPRSGDVPAPPGSLKGTAVTVWTDDNGYLDSPPLALSEVANQADAATIGVIVAAGVIYICGAGATRQLLNRRRMAAWDADWVTTAPAWNRQRW
ncbi:MAG: Rv1733c family protein [Trebonia sp.]